MWGEVFGGNTEGTDQNVHDRKLPQVNYTLLPTGHQSFFSAQR